MLVLTRKKNESLLIGEEIVVTIVDIMPDKVKIGIDCPREISICRSEIADVYRKPKTEKG